MVLRNPPERALKMWVSGCLVLRGPMNTQSASHHPPPNEGFDLSYGDILTGAVVCVVPLWNRDLHEETCDALGRTNFKTGHLRVHGAA